MVKIGPYLHLESVNKWIDWNHSNVHLKRFKGPETVESHYYIILHIWVVLYTNNTQTGKIYLSGIQSKNFDLT